MAKTNEDLAEMFEKYAEDAHARARELADLTHDALEVIDLDDTYATVVTAQESLAAEFGRIAQNARDQS